MSSIEVMVNGQPVQLAGEPNISTLIKQLGLAGKRIAVEVNLDIIPRGEHSSLQLQLGDRVEIIHAIGGGQE